MPPSCPPESPCPDPIAGLERRHDGAPPPDALSAALAGGAGAAAVRRRRGLVALHRRLAAEARLGLALRRLAVGSRVLEDGWLVRLGASLTAHRAAALGFGDGAGRSDRGDGGAEVVRE